MPDIAEVGPMEDRKKDPGRRATEATVKFVAVLSVHVSTACCKTVLTEPSWEDRMTPEDHSAWPEKMPSSLEVGSNCQLIFGFALFSQARIPGSQSAIGARDQMCTAARSAPCLDDGDAQNGNRRIRRKTNSCP
ncbi:hypothetical protein U8Q06_27600 (plasmid) [Rhizobium beringeri]|uniref:hypothetical protein n=1 Tax=Rhizobium beringeri TaxID=3019934 RepID=UPI002E1088C4|nr:hypothetical protein U8Q06_27600 [Rhizobium beringeri]